MPGGLDIRRKSLWLPGISGKSVSEPSLFMTPACGPPFAVTPRVLNLVVLISVTDAMVEGSELSIGN